MSRKNWFLVGKVVVILAMLFLGFLMYDKLPAQIPTHRNFQGEIDGYGSKLATILGLPGLCVGFLIIFYVLPKIDPQKERYKEFSLAWEWIQMILILFLAYFYGVIFYVIFHPSLSITPFVFGGFSILFIVLGVAMKHVKRNYFVGIKTPWTLANDEVWEKTHLLGFRTFSIAGIVCFLSVVFGIYIFSVFLSSILLAALIPVVYSYYIYKKIGMKK